MYVDPYVYAGTYLLNLCTFLIYFPLPASMWSILLARNVFPFGNSALRNSICLSLCSGSPSLTAQ